MPILWLAALACALMPVPGYETRFLIAGVLGLAAAFLTSLYSVAREGAALKFSPLIAVGCVFWALAFASVVFSQVRLESYLYFWFFSALPLSFLVFSLNENAAAARRAGAGALILLVALALANFYFYFFAPEWLHVEQAGWPFADPNALAGFTLFGFFGALGLSFAATGKAQRMICALAAGLFLACIAATGSRAALAALAVSAAIFFFGARTKGRIVEFGVFALAAVILCAAVTLFAKTHAFPSPMDSAARQNGVSLFEVRGALWSSAWDIIKTHLWTGTGVGTFYLYYPEVRGADFGTAGLHAHNDVLEFASDMGVFAPVLLYVFIILAVIRTIRACKAAPELKVGILAPFCALGAMVAHAHLEFNFYVLPTLMISGLALAFWMRATNEALRENDPARWPWAGAALAGIVLALGVCAFTGAAVSEIMIQNAQRAQGRGDLEAFGGYVNAADIWSGGNNARAYALAAEIPLGLLETGQGDRAALLEQARTLLEKSLARNPRSAATLVQVARLAYLGGDAQKQERALADAVALNPLYLPARLELARLYRAQGRDRDAYMLLKAGLRWPYDDPRAGDYFNDVAVSAPLFDDAETASIARTMKTQYEARLSMRAARKDLASVFSTAM